MKAWEYLEKKGAWCHGAMARDKDDHPCYPGSKDAVTWCLLGAIFKAYPERRRGVIYSKMYKFLGLHDSMSTWNDDPKRTKRQVIALLKKVEGSGRLSDAHGGCRDPRPTTAAI